jgi:hypothetical protein
MKAILFTAAATVAAAMTLASASAFADKASDLEAQAQKAYGARDFSQPGLKSSIEAADLYAEAAASSTDANLKAKYLVGQATALFFAGSASDANNEKLDKHSKGMAAADQATKLLGLADVGSVTDAQLKQLKASLSKENLALLAEALYERGINLGEWGQANGVMQSLSKWPELRHNMESIETLGLVALHDYGAYRVLGRGYFKIPGLLGGDMAKAEKYLSTAVSKTPASGMKISKNGYNNIYYADILHSNGDDEKATKLLQDFIKADASKLDPDTVPETRHNQKEAQDLLKSW